LLSHMPWASGLMSRPILHVCTVSSWIYTTSKEINKEKHILVIPWWTIPQLSMLYMSGRLNLFAWEYMVKQGIEGRDVRPWSLNLLFL
jgi:hypothetical protein